MGNSAAGGQALAGGMLVERGPTEALRIADAARSGTDLLAEYVRACGGGKPLRRILIASNGMAAAKAIMSLRQWAYMESGLDSVFTFVAMATREDLGANAEFIRLADSFVEVPPGKNVNNYANVGLICETAVKQKVDAVWPGWGHASENPKLPAKLAELGITFVGPSSPVMAVLGDKIAAGILAQTAGVPSIPWSGDGLKADLTPEGTIPEETFRKATLTTLEEAISCAQRIGFPVVLKASEGGGGKGIRMSASKEELVQHFAQVQAEVPGSPIFMMQLCTGARHIEVQIVGDKHGNVVALNGRDCSTQRRFQKIFEEGPPVVVPRDKFREMERAAQRLTKNIGYVGAGTIEYLYNAETNQFYFLELNPRLQVEHPVTEAITQVNLPATQVQVAMGIPLDQMPQIRHFYGKAPSDRHSPIDFMRDDYVYPTVHCMAARITAENPDDGFKPTSGKIHRIKFQSSVACWGYFSVWTHAGIHEFADSQFGHLFARGANREEARKTLMLALKNLDVVGEIRNPVEYLVELLATEAFVRNGIDTSWLDGIIRAKSVKPHYEHFDVVFYAAVFRIAQAARARDDELADAVSKRRLGLIGQAAGLNSFEVEIAFEGLRYNFRAARTGDDLFAVDIGQDRICAQVRVQPDGSLLVAVGNSVMKVFGTEDALGLRLRLQGIGTVVLPTIYDPTELRSEFNGKVIRYLQPDGATVRSGDAYVELEAMKMVMPLKAGATGNISHAKGVGGIVQAGELLASLRLEDPSSAQTLSTFHGHFELAAAATPGEGAAKVPGALGDPLAGALSVLDGFAPMAAPEALAREALSASAAGADDEDSIDIDTLSVVTGNSRSVSEAGRGRRPEDEVRAVAAAGALLDRYLEVERRFAAHALPGQSEDIAYAALVEESKDDPKGVVALLRARSQLEARNKVVLAALGTIRSMRGDADAMLRSLAGRVQALAELPAAGGHGEVLTVARRLSKQLGLQGCSERRAALKDAIRVQPLEGMGKLSTWDASKAGCDLLVGLLEDDVALVRSKALEIFIRRTYRAFGVSADSKVHVTDGGRGKMSARWRFRHPGVSTEEGSTQAWTGYCIAVSDLAALAKFIRNASFPFNQDNQSSPREGGNRCRLHAILGAASPFEMAMEQVQVMLNSAEAALKATGVCEFVLVMPAAPGSAGVLHYATFATAGEGGSWSEVLVRRDMSPTVFSLLEVSCLSKEYELEQLGHRAEWSSHVFLGTKKSEAGTSAKPPRHQTVFARLFSHSRVNFEGPVGRWSDQLEATLLGIVHDLESAALGRFPSSASSTRAADSRLFLHLTSLVDFEPSALNSLLEGFMQRFVSRHGAQLQKSWVDEIVLKVRLGRDACQATLRFATSSVNGEYMKSVGLLEKVHPACGTPATRMHVGSGEEVVAGGSAADDKLRGKRMAARRAGSTYAPEFLGMLEAALVNQWTSYCRQVGGSVPKELLKSIELVMDPSGELKEIERPAGLNDIGMLAWRLVLKTPEYPDGRSVVLIANDVTHKAGSFGVVEDSFFMKATRFARDRGLPRVHLSCNSGARVGLVEELMPKLRVKWNDPSDPARGFEYLYLSEDDFKQLPSGAALARRVEGTSDGLGPHFALEAVVGEGLASTAGGIGVENLQGSGLIAGETSRAYSEIFTLSFITGRSVGIGAYLNRLGQRTIQAVDGPMILTGYSALNKLLGREVYSSQDQLGGAQVMVPNGVTHELVRSDQEGAQAIVDWLSYVPRDTWSLPPSIRSADPPSRRIDFKPTREPYDPRDMLAGVQTPEGFTSGFFDAGSFKEYLSGWGRTVVVGRARLGGMPMGVVAVETRNVERRVPADPGNPESHEIVEAQAGQVWFPDSAHKTAAAIRDFNRGENLPLMIFANWRGFSGGTRDMYGEVLKFGAQIVDALVDYKHPVFIYIPPFGELRGGSWVVIDPAINPCVMEMYADVESRGGILEPAGIVEVKFREPQRREMMHRLDEGLAGLDRELQSTSASGRSAADIKADIAAREAQLQPLYTQVACEFADLHDRTGRMKATGCIREGLEWASAREFFYWRVRCRVLEQQVVKDVMAADSALAAADAKSMVARWLPRGGDREAVEFLEKTETVQQKVRGVRQAAVRRQIAALQAELGEAAEAAPGGGSRRWLPRLLCRTGSGRSAATPKTPKTPSSTPPGASPAPTASPSAAYPGLLGSERPGADAKGIKQRE